MGGAEALVRGLATRATPPGWSAEVAATCAVDHVSWRDALPAGETAEDGIRVHRFPVGPRDAAAYDRLHPAVLSGSAGYSTQLEWLAQSVWSPALGAFLEARGGDYDLVVLAPYLFGTTVWGALIDPGRSALMPCLHDEPYARLDLVGRVMESVRGCVFNAPGEERLARRLYRVRGGGVVGMGHDAPAAPPAARFAEPRGLGRYVLYAGRLEEGKRVQVAVEWAVRHARERPDAPRLVLIGRGGYRPPPEAAGVVVEAGYVSEEDKRAAYAEALALVNPSTMESLSLVLMEAWLEGTPAVVASGSEVMRDHCERSGGGWAVDGYEGYREAIEALLDDPGLGRRRGDAGREYVLDVYGWPAVRERFRAVAEALAP
jgi:glycosyltransferase involved in cell wall biosynthesis